MALTSQHVRESLISKLAALQLSLAGARVSLAVPNHYISDNFYTRTDPDYK
jgi:hypothetical protein